MTSLANNFYNCRKLAILFPQYFSKNQNILKTKFLASHFIQTNYEFFKKIYHFPRRSCFYIRD